MKPVLFLSALLLLATGAAAADLDYTAARALAEHDEASLEPAQMQALVAAQGEAARAAFAACPVQSPDDDLSPFTVVMELDATGKVVRTWRHGDSPLAQCFHAGMSHATLAVPPRTPFYTFFDMTWKP
jgi:hypothetical protein